MKLNFFEMIELKGRNGGRHSWRFKIGVWLAKRVLTALANDKQLRKEFGAIVQVEGKE